MDEKTLATLEYVKILQKLAGYAAFRASEEMAFALRPTSDLQEALKNQQRTTEARRLLDTISDFSVGGVYDIREPVDLANHGGVLPPHDLMDIKNTLLAARETVKSFSRRHEQFPMPVLAEIVIRITPPPNLPEMIGRCISDRGDILDSASDKLATIRREIRIAYDRLMSKLEHMVNDPKSALMLQEPIITQRNGRYVIPLRSEFKGKVRSIIHDQSSSGATLFVEPLVVVELNNRWQELQLAERDEERRILADLSGQVGRNAETILQSIIAVAELDFALMCAKYGEDLHAAEPILTPIKRRDAAHPGAVIKLYKARHPLLEASKVVPIDITFDPSVYTLVITGPNTGGKTVSLKTTGLLVLMAQSGLHIPAQSGSTLSIFENVFADIGDEQSIEQSLSTFSGHITNIVRVLNLLTPSCLVLFDELGAGTDPLEGAALARAILSYLVKMPVTSMVATHYPELKAYAHNTPGVMNASMEFDLQSLRPTYHLNIGLPGRSNALLIAQRLGLSQEIIEGARAEIDPQNLRADDLLEEIHRQRDLARKSRAAADKSALQADKLRSDLNKRLDKIDEERLKIIEQARQDARVELEKLQAEITDMRKALQRAHQPLDELKAIQEQAEMFDEELEKPVASRRQPRKEKKVPAGRFQLGQKVRIRSLQMEGRISELDEEEAVIEVGTLKMRTRLDDLLRTDEVEEKIPAAPQQRQRPSAATPVNPLRVLYPSPGMELDLRGQRAEDALDALDRYLESAFLAGLPFVRIIHGKGTGRLRQVVRDALKQSSHVKTFEQGQDNEGGEGVTVARLATE